jgi:hypothetical protein
MGWVFEDTGEPVELADIKPKKRDPRMPNFAPKEKK